jgi:hypothetical protein
MLINKKITVLFIIFFAVIFLLPETVFAQTAGDFGTDKLSSVNLGNQDLQKTISGIINVFLGFLGILATIIILYGGFVWMTSGGNAEKIDKAKRILINGVIGLLIILSSYAIARFILTEGSDGIFGGGGVGGGGYVGGVGLGAGALDSHYPAPNANEIPRNTNIYATFKEPMDISRIVDTANCTGPNAEGIDTCNANEDYIKLFAQGSTDPITGPDLLVSYDTNALTGFRSFKFDPYGVPDGVEPDYLGSPNTNVRYRMQFGDLQTQNDQSAFIGGGYAWRFTTGTELDVTPPTVISVRPRLDDNSPRNAVVQINFSEAINPVFVTGLTSNLNLEVFLRETTFDTGPLVNGKYEISNQYKTVEFITDNFCGTNSCGGDVFCLPETTLIAARAGALIEDMAENALGTDYDWTFTTTDEIDLVPPTVSTMQDPNGLNPYEPIELTFSKELSGSSVNSDNIGLSGVNPIDFWFRLSSGDGSDQALNARTISIRHGRFDPSSFYRIDTTSGIKDLNQNCWYEPICNDPIGNPDNPLGGSCVCGTSFPVNTAGNGFNCIGS